MPRERLTDKLLKSKRIVPVEGQVDLWDELTPGFGLRVSYGGRKAFQVMTRINGKLVRKTIGGYPRSSLAEARDLAERILKDAAKGIDHDLEERQRLEAQSRNSFGQVAAKFMLDHAAKLRTRDQLQRMLDKELLPEWGARPIASITRADVKGLIREKARVAPISANRLASLVSKIFGWAVDEDIIAASPAVRLKRADEQERERSLTDEEIRILWPAFERLGYPFGHALKFLLVTGQRRGEVCNLKWSEIATGNWVLPGASAKSKKGHFVPLSSLAHEIIESCPNLGERVFMSGRGAGPLQGWDGAKARVDASLKAALIEPWRIHDLRRTMATQMRTIGIDRLVVSKLLNHAEAGITRVYDRYSADPEKIAAAERWANRLREIVGGAPGDNVVPMKKLSGAA
jgi:integrase